MYIKNMIFSCQKNKIKLYDFVSFLLKTMWKMWRITICYGGSTYYKVAMDEMIDKYF
jgi:hypothetical protein